MKATQELNNWYDVIVVGARVAGAGVGMLLARAGLRALIVDRGHQGHDTVSTHALMRAGVLQLHRWGVLERLKAAGTPPIRRATYHYGSNAIQTPIRERDGVDAVYSPRRWLLDAALADAARDAGADLSFRTSVRELLTDRKGRVRGVTLVDGEGVTRSVAAEMVIGADGIDSVVAKSVGARTMLGGRSMSSVLYGYWSGLELDGTHWMYGDGVSAGAIPTNAGQACVFAAMRPERFKRSRPSSFTSLLDQVVSETNPGFGRALRQVSLDSSIIAFPGRVGYLRQAWGSGWALVGDAGCFKDPITAHGMTDALRDAELLARALVARGEDGLAEYQDQRDSFGREFLDLSDRLAAFDWTLEEAQELHRQLSKLMNRECDLISSWGSPAAPESPPAMSIEVSRSFEACLL